MTNDQTNTASSRNQKVARGRRPAQKKRRRKRFQDALTACNQQYGKALKQLGK
jgi:hypothetical protein